jgi:hypothetical protein
MLMYKRNFIQLAMLLHGTNESIDRAKIRQYNDIGYGSAMGKYRVLEI